MTLSTHSSVKDLNFTRLLGSKLPVLLQAEAAECGLVCLAMICQYHGKLTSVSNMRKNFPISGHGLNLQDLSRFAEKLGFSARALSLELDEANQLTLPCIIHWNFDHFVVLKKVSRKYVLIHDPAVGEVKVSHSLFSKQFTGVALELETSSSFCKTDKTHQALGLVDFVAKSKGLYSGLLQIFWLSLFLQLFVLASPFYVQTVVDAALMKGDTDLLVILAIGFTILVLLQVGTGFIRDFASLRLSNIVSYQMASNLFTHLIQLPVNYFSARHMGDVVSRFGSQDKVREMLTNGVVTVLIDGLLAITTVVVLFIYSTKLALIVVSVVFVYCLIRYVFYQPLKLLSQQSLVTKAHLDSHFMESIRAIQIIKLYEKESWRKNRWLNLLASNINANIKIGAWQVSYGSVNTLLFGLENILVIYLAAKMVMANEMSLGMLYAFISYKMRFVTSINNLVNQFVSFKMLDVHLARMEDIVFTPVDKANPNAVQYPEVQPYKSRRLEVRDLSFRYGENEQYVFQHLNFIIEAGQTVAITGASGCGKSTLIKCLMGLLTPTQGKILVDGIPIQDVADYRQSIAGILQDDQLLSGTLMENITCFDSEPNETHAFDVTRMVNLHEEINQMPMQYNTLINDLGAGISGGQSQRLILARALYRRPGILFMDEATSNLDGDNERSISQRIKSLNITRVLVAHRQETISIADHQIDMNACKSHSKSDT